MEDQQETQNHTQPPRFRSPFLTANLGVFVFLASLFILLIFINLPKESTVAPSKEEITAAFPKEEGTTAPSKEEISAAPTKKVATPPQREEQIVVNVTQLEYDSLLHAFTVSGKVKNFTNRTFETVKLRFTFYDRAKQMVHTETRVIFLFERFRPGDIYAFKEQFFNLPSESHYVTVEVEDAW